MAGVHNPAHMKTKNKGNKRKHRTASLPLPLPHEEEEEEEEEEEKEQAPGYTAQPSSKIPRFNPPETTTILPTNAELDNNSPWKNLQLVLSLQDPKLDLLKKVDLACDYVESSSIEEMDDVNLPSQVMSTSRTLVFLNNWVQSVLISSEKKMKLENNKPVFGTFGSCLDLRCWKILHFCLEKAKNLHVSLACSRDFLRVIRWIVIDASSCVGNVCHEATDSCERLEFYDVVLLCISLVFSFHGGVANENLDLWISLLQEVLKLVLKIVDVQLDGSFIFKLSCYLLEPFAKFLRVHPTRKSGFHDFIDKLLEPLLHLLYVVRNSSYDTIIEWRTDMSKLVEEVLAQGLFHPTHIDGFLILHNIDKYKSCTDAPAKEEKLVNRSYHRHLFDKMEKTVANKNGLALLGLRELLQLFVKSVVKHKTAVINGRGSSQSVLSSRSHVPDDRSQRRMLVSENIPGKHGMDAELRKSICNYFVQIMEFLLADVNKHLQSFEEVVYLLPNFVRILRSSNHLLASFMCENLYQRTEDATEGAFKNFLTLIYDMIMSISTKISNIRISSFSSDEKSIRVPLISVKKELIVTVHHLLEIEYEVVGDDLERLWTMVFSSVSCCYSAVDELDQPVLLSEILSFSCRLIDMYSELRQVNSSIFALCKALRHSISVLGGSKECTSSFTDSLNMLLCSPEFRVSLSNAIKAMPEGQAAGCIRLLISDIEESLKWITCNPQFVGIGTIAKANNSDLVYFDLQAELLGKALSEVYTVILDSIPISSGNSSVVGASLKNLLSVIRPCLSSIISRQPDNTEEFSIVVSGRILSKGTGCENAPMCWILLLFFRLVLSCRSLSRQVISSMPPDASKEMSEAIGDPLTAYSGTDWLQSPRSVKGLFPGISRYSLPLLDLLSSTLDISYQDSVVRCPPLVYASIAMALQRLVDLNRLMKSFKYVLLWNQTESRIKLRNDADFLERIRKSQKYFSLIKSFRYMLLWSRTRSKYTKMIRRWKICFSQLKEEASGLTKLIMKSLSSVADDQISAPAPDSGLNEISIRGLNNKNALNFPLGGLDKKCLPCALWWIICQNVEVWCSHAAKKDLKNFLTLLIHASASSVHDHANHFQKFKPISGHLKKVTPHQMALRFMGNTISFEQNFVHRYMASRFCRILQESVLSAFGSSVVDLNKSMDWCDVMSAMENHSAMQSDAFPWIKESMVPADCCNKQTKFAPCQTLLRLLVQMPEEYLSSRSSSLYISCIVNLERLLVGSLLGLYNASRSDGHEIFQLFVSCRKALKILIVASCKENENEGQSPPSLKLLDGSFPLTWLLKSLSATIGFRNSLSDDLPFEAKVTMFSLMNHTSNALKTISRNQFKHAISLIISARKFRSERKILGPGTEGSKISEPSLQMNCANLEACNGVLQLAETLAAHLQTILTTFIDGSRHKKIDGSTGYQGFYNLSSIVACFQGLLWGLASALADTDAVNTNFRVKFSRYNTELLTRLDSCISTFMNFLTLFLRELILEDDLTLKGPVSDCNGSGAGGPSSGGCDGFYEGPGDVEMEHSGEMELSDGKRAAFKRNTLQAIRDLEGFLKDSQGEGLRLKGSLLLDCLRGQNAEVAFVLQQLFLGYSALLRLNMQIGLPSVSWTLFPATVGIYQFVLREFSTCVEMPHQSTFFCLDGVVKLLEELGTYFPQFDPSLTRDSYMKLIDLHLRAIGRCISLQGKDAKLSSQETGSHTKMLRDQGYNCFSLERSQVGELKEKFRTSFTTYVRGASELQLLSSIQSVERALVGVQEGLITNYEISFGNSDGGKVSPLSAAGIECVDLILEYATGQKRLNMTKSHIQAVVACIFNVILHLQAPNIFYKLADSIKAHGHPDSGSVILMCIEVLTKISAKPSFHIDACHIAQSLRVPAPLFQYFLRLQISPEALSGNRINDSTIDRKFSIELYAACCRMLCTTLKHHKGETWQCISLLDDSVGVLLQCLEIVNVDFFSGKHAFAWEVQEAVKCASSLRRVYEEVRQQKDVFGQSSFQLLSRYIWVYCGFGRAGNGIIREVDEALRPGLYALIDCCSADDLQLLHTQFGEGPCRSTLAALQHDYKINFRFEGKV